MNVASDLASRSKGVHELRNMLTRPPVMVLPIWMLGKLQMPTSKMVGLACIFSLGFVIIVLDILRIALGDGGGIISLASLWDILEPSIAVIVSTLPTYRSLLPSAGKSARRKLTPYRYDSSGVSDSQQGWKKRATARHRDEGYELNDDLQILHPTTISGGDRSTGPGEKAMRVVNDWSRNAG